VSERVTDALQMGFEGLSQALERYPSTASCLADPLIHQRHHRDVWEATPGDDVAQPLLESPRAPGLELGLPKMMQIDFFRCPILGVFEPVCARALEQRLCRYFTTPYGIHRLVGELDQMERIKTRQGVGQVLPDTGDVALRHVHAATFDR